MFKNLMSWIEYRLPFMEKMNLHVMQYPAPKNFNFWYFFGSLAILVLVNQILTGIWLTMNYVPSAEGAFASVEYIMRDVDYGWLLRYMHSTGASAFFVVVYLHMLRGMMYGSYQKPRELLWIFGMLIFLVLMAEAFMGYLLPWGQMSFWGAQVIIGIFGTILVILVFLHIMALHEVGSNNPDGIEVKRDNDGSVEQTEADKKFTFHQYFTKGGKKIIVDAIPFHPYYTVKDMVGVAGFLLVFAWVIFFLPEGGGFFLEPPNFEAANPLKTPEHIAPVWYFTPFYAILRAIPHPFMGAVAMFAAILALALLPWLDRGKVRSVRYRSNLHKLNLVNFCISFVALGVLGVLPATPTYTLLSQIFSFTYFGFFILLFFYSKNEATKPLPVRLT